MQTRRWSYGFWALVFVAVGIVAAACTPPVSPPSETSTTSTTSTTTPPPPRYAVVPLANRGIAYDKVRDRLLVSVADSVPAIGNHLVEMNPRSGALGRSLELPGGPSMIAVADDSSRAYVGMRNAPTVVEVDLATFAITRTIALGLGGTRNEPIFAFDIDVQPGHPDVIAVVRDDCCSTAFAGAAIYDRGVQRPTTVGWTVSPNRITWGPTPGTIYGFYNGSTGFDFYVLSVTPTGVTATKTGSLVTGFGVDIEYANGAVHATSGQVVDVTGSPVLAGSYVTSGPLEVDPASNTTSILNGTTLSRHDSTRLIRKSSETVAAINPRELVGAGSLLAAAGDSSVMLLGEGVTSSGFALPSPPPSVVTTPIVSVPVAARALVASPDGTRVFATVPQAADSHPGEVIEIDTASAAITRSLFVGADPAQIAISDDGSTLMVGHRSASRLTEVRVADLSIVRTVQLPNLQWSGDITAVPGAPTSFVVAEDSDKSSAQVDGVFLVRDGVIVANPTRIRFAPTAVAFAGEPSRLYGHDGSNTGFDFTVMSMDSSGIRVNATIGKLLPGFNLTLTSSAGRLYASNGGVVDPSVPRAIGKVAAGLPVPVPGAGRLLSVAGNTIREFDLVGFWPVATTTFAGGTATDAALVGSTLAIAATSSVVLVPLSH